MTKYTESDKTDNSSTAIDATLMVGDPILVKVKEKLQICKIDLIKEANKKVKALHTENLDKPLVNITVTPLKVREHGDVYIWEDKVLGKPFSTSGVRCIAIQPDLKDVAGEIYFAFDKQFVLDYNVAITRAVIQEPRSSASSSNSVEVSVSASQKNPKSKSQKKGSNLLQCHTCKKNVTHDNMRIHVAHIIKGKLSNCCVFLWTSKHVREHLERVQQRKKTAVFSKSQVLVIINSSGQRPRNFLKECLTQTG